MAGLALQSPVTCEADNEVETDEVNSSEKSETRKADISLPAGLKNFLLVVPCKLRLICLAAFILLKANVS